jgi:hypothetical protein
MLAMADTFSIVFILKTSSSATRVKTTLMVVTACESAESQVSQIQPE